MDPDVLPVDTTEARVLGSLIEKSMTTPDQYPLSLNAVRLACNQVSNRDPVLDFDETTVAGTLRRLADRGLAKFVHRPGDRVVKYIHDVGTVLDLDDRSLALLAVLLLRGDQTPGELRQRTARYVEFERLAAVEATLERMRAMDPPLVEELAMSPGQKESRWRNRIVADDEPTEPMADAGPTPTAAPDAGRPVTDGADDEDDLAALRSELNDLRKRFDRLLDLLGVDDL